MRQLAIRLAVVIALAFLAGCERASVYGTVVDERGELLPGVIVTAERSREQDLSNAMGEYSIQFRPRGTQVLRFEKTGFTPALLELHIEEARSVQAQPVEMWRVPISPGVYALENFRFESTTPVEIESFSLPDGLTLYGTQRDPEFLTRNQAPIIILYRIPAFDVRLARLEEQPITFSEGKPIEDGAKAWTLVEPLAADLEAIDEPEGLLRRLVFDVPLNPGVYAVHWGAFFGRTAIESRVFLFRVLGPDEEIAPVDTATDEETTEDAPETPPAEEVPEDAPADDGGGF